MNDRYRQRDYYRNNRRRNNQQSDAIVVALTTQIIICLALLLFAGTLKKVDEPGFERVKQQYEEMTAEEQGAQPVSEMVSQWVDGFNAVFVAVEQTIGTTLDNIFGLDAQQEAAQQEPAQQPAGYDFGFDYTQAALKPAGRSGILPDKDDKQMSAPTGATLAPVYYGARFIAPVEGIITSSFAYRYHPITDNVDFHNGIDIAAEEGRNILAALPGEVTEVGYDKVYGNYIIVKHAMHLETFYAHCSEIIAQEGMAVRQGERIAKVGATGMVTGPHLHFCVIVDGEYTDPLWALSDLVQVVE